MDGHGLKVPNTDTTKYPQNPPYEQYKFTQVNW